MLDKMSILIMKSKVCYVRQEIERIKDYLENSNTKEALLEVLLEVLAILEYTVKTGENSRLKIFKKVLKELQDLKLELEDVLSKDEKYFFQDINLMAEETIFNFM